MGADVLWATRHILQNFQIKSAGKEWSLYKYECKDMHKRLEAVDSRFKRPLMVAHKEESLYLLHRSLATQPQDPIVEGPQQTPLGSPSGFLGQPMQVGQR